MKAKLSVLRANKQCPLNLSHSEVRAQENSPKIAEGFTRTRSRTSRNLKVAKVPYRWAVVPK